jgi:hypothetical protein
MRRAGGLLMSLERISAAQCKGSFACRDDVRLACRRIGIVRVVELLRQPQLPLSLSALNQRALQSEEYFWLIGVRSDHLEHEDSLARWCFRLHVL